MPLSTEVFRHYETIVLVHPDTSDTERGEAKDRLAGIIEERGGKITRWETWGKRRLAYEVQKQNKAHYLYVNYVSPQTVVAEVERNLRIMEPIILFQTVRLQELVNMDTFDVEEEGKKRTPLFMSDEDIAAAERNYQREHDWAQGNRGEEGDSGPSKDGGRPAV